MVSTFRWLSRLFVLGLLLATAAGAEILIGGRVTGPGGKGVDGANVALEPILPGYQRVEMRLGGASRAEPAVRSRSGRDGYFELTAPRPGAWKVTAEASGYVDMEFLLEPLHEAVELPPAQLQPASALEIKVFDPLKKPVPARVGLYDTRRRQGWRNRLRLAETGDGGIVRLPRERGEVLRIEVLGPSHPLLFFNHADEKENDFVGVTIQPGVAGKVRVTDPAGRPLAGVMVFQGIGILPLGSTDEDGRLDFVLAAAEYEPPAVSFLAPDGHGAYEKLRFSSDEAGIESIKLAPPRRLHGQVIDVVSREPVAEALVWADGGPYAETDAGGRYELAGLYSSRVRVQATATGYGLTVEHRNLDTTEDRATLALTPAASVSGEVVDGDGHPIAGVSVSLESVGQRFRGRVSREGKRTTRSSHQGRFQLSRLPLSGDHELRFNKAGFAATRHGLDALQPFENRTGLRVILDAGRTGIGWVVDEDGAPVAGAAVRLEPTPKGDRRLAKMWSQYEDAASGLATAAGDDGSFRIPHLGPGRYDLEVEAAGYAPAAVPGFEVDAGHGEVDFGTVTLESGARLEGTVLDPNGTPLAEAEIHVGEERSAYLMANEEPRTRSDAQGRFTVSDLRRDKPLYVTVVKSGYGSETLTTVTPGGEPVEVVLHPAGRVSGRVMERNGDPVAEVHVQIDTENPHQRSDVRRRPDLTDERGAFELDDVQPGTVTLRVYSPEHQRYELKGLKVPAGGELSGLEIVLEPGATVAGTVTEADGTPVAQAKVSLSSGDDSGLGFGPASFAETDGDGRYRLTGVAPGPARLDAQQQSHRKTSKSIEVRPGAQTVDLTFEAGFDVSGWVATSDGAAVPGASLTLQKAETGTYRMTFGGFEPVKSAADGTFLLAGVAAGRYTLTASKEGFAQARTEEPVDVHADVSGLVLEFERGATLRGRVLGLAPEDLAKVELVAFSMGTGGQVRGAADHEGTYSVPNLPSGPWTVMARMTETERHVTGQVTVEAGATEAWLDLEFKEGFPVAGVVTRGGKPASGIQVLFQGIDAGLAGAQAATGTDGRFRIEDLPAGTYRVMFVAGTTRPFVSEEIEVPTGDELHLEIGGVRIAGQVLLDADDQPVREATLHLDKLDADPMDPFAMGFSRMPAGKTDAQGRFELNVQPGRWRLSAAKPGHGPAETTLEAHAGAVLDAVELRMSPSEGITFEAVLESGRPPQQVSAMVLDAAGRQVSHGIYEAVEGGRFRITTIPAGQWELYVQSRDTGAVRMPITAPGHVGRIELPRGAKLQLTVAALKDDSGWAHVMLTGPDGRPLPVLGRVGPRVGWPMMGGRALIPQLNPGLWTFEITHTDGRTWSGQAMVTAGETVEVEVP